MVVVSGVSKTDSDESRATSTSTGERLFCVVALFRRLTHISSSRYRYQLAKGTNLIDYAEQLADQVKHLDDVKSGLPGRLAVTATSGRKAQSD